MSRYSGKHSKGASRIIKSIKRQEAEQRQQDKSAVKMLESIFAKHQDEVTGDD